MLMTESRMLTAKEFAEESGVSYPLVIRWLKAGDLPGAVFVKRFRAWQIPATLTAVYKKPENRPKKGWKLGRKRKAQSQGESA